LQPPKTYVLNMHNIRNNPQLKQPTPKSLYLSNVVFLSAPHFPFNGIKEYDLIEQLKNTHTKISLWDLIEKSPNYHVMLKTSLQKVMITPNVSTNDVSNFIQRMNVINVEIIFHQHEILPLEM
jgi:hypothetical protein